MSRKINFPKLDWNIKADEYENAEPELSEEIYKVLKEDLDAITNNKAINPHDIQTGLRAVNFHKDYPEIYKIIDDMCLIKLEKD